MYDEIKSVHCYVCLIIRLFSQTRRRIQNNDLI
jgi:hypothetical protein